MAVMRYTIPQGEGGERKRAKYQTYTGEGGKMKIRPMWRGGIELALSKGNRWDAKGKHRWGRRKGKLEGEGRRDEKAR